jgi:hypothetical protein
MLPSKKTKVNDCYVGIKPCGCMVAWVYDDPMYPQDVAKSIDEFRRSGYSVERMSGAFHLRKLGVKPLLGFVYIAG